MNPLLEFAERRAADRDSVFIFYKDDEISYPDFLFKVNLYSSYLKKIRINEGDNVAVISENNPDFIQIIFSLWKLKSIAVPINTRLLKQEIEEQIKFAGCKFVLMNKDLSLNIDHPNVIRFPPDIKGSEKFPDKDYDTNDTALIMFTSGSSGKSKAVMLTFENLIQSNRIGNQILNQNEKDKWLASLPFYHIGGFSIITRTFLSAASLIIPDSLKIEEISAAIKKYKPTLASLVAAQLQRLINGQVKPNKELKNVLIGGGFTGKDLSLTAVNKGWNITKVYGSTEVSSFISAITYKEVEKKPGSSGKALYPNEIVIVDEKKRKLGPNISGEIIVKSSSVMKEYFKDPEETSRKLINGYYYTGDIGYLDNEGYLFVEARRNDLIVSGGENINPKEVEAAILSCSSVCDVFVFGVDDEEWGQQVCAAIVMDRNSNTTTEKFLGLLREKLSSFKIPKKIFFVNEIPRTSLGKVQKERLMKLVHLK